MFIASAATTVKFHEFPSGNVTYNYQPGTKVEGPIRSISWSKDGNWLALVPYSGLTEIVSVKDQLKLIHTIQNTEKPSCAVFQNTTKKNIALGTKDGQVLIYDIKSRAVKKRYPRSSSMVTHVDFTPKDTHIVAGCKNGDVLLYSNITNTLSSSFKVPRSNSVSALRCNPLKRNLILGGSNEGVVVVWDTNTNRNKFFIESHKAPVTAAAFSPINSDLVVSTGLDRQFCFYDIVDNKCIASVSVENSLMAVDFSDNGTYIVMASQNGRVYIYDSRNIQEPVHSFEAHKTSIKHLAFQNLPDVNTTSNCSITADSIKQMPSIEDVRDHGRNSDLFGLFIPIPSGEASPKSTSNSIEAGDSFMAALGLDKNNAAQSIKEDEISAMHESVKDTRNEFHETPAASYSKKAANDKLGKYDASTPNFAVQNTQDIAMSPIISSSNGPMLQNSVSVAEIQNAAKEAVKEELKNVFDEIKLDMKYQSMSTVSQMRRMCLDLHMSMIKEFVKLENQYNVIKEDMTSEIVGGSEVYLAEENANLKKKVAYLEEQLAGLMVKPQNGTVQTP